MNRLTFTRPTSGSSSGRQKLARVGKNPRELETPAGLLRDIEDEDDGGRTEPDSPDLPDGG